MKNQSSSFKNFIIFILLLIVAGFCYYNFSYLLTPKRAEPVTATTTVKKVVKEAPKEPTVIVNEAFDIAAATFPVVGAPGHPASGSMRILPTRGTTIIQFENLNFKSETGLHLYFSKDLTNTSIIDLGPIKGSSGTISYTVPDTVNPGEYRYVLTWSTKSNTLFNHVLIPENPI